MTEQPDRDEDQGTAANCHLCVGAGGYEDHDGEWRECSCQQADREPSDAEVVAALNAWQDRINLGTSLSDWGSFKVARMRAALIAAQEVRDES